MAEQVEVLEDHSDVAPQVALSRRIGGNEATAKFAVWKLMPKELDHARIGTFEAGYQPEYRGLSRAAAPDQDKALAYRDGERKVGQDDRATKRFADR
jgi:hypothetical protein